MQNKKGFALFFTLGFIAIIFLIGSSYIFLAANELALTLKTGDAVKAFYLAEAGLARKLMELETGDDSNISPAVGVPFPDGNSGTYRVIVVNDVIVPLTEYLITSTGVYNGAHGNSVKQVEMRVRGKSAAHYAGLNDLEELWFRGTRVANAGWYITGAIMEGAIHTNEHLHIAGRPIFDGTVTQAGTVLPNGYEGFAFTNNNPDFRQGFSFGVPAIALPAGDFIADLRHAANQDHLPPRAGAYPNNWQLNGDTTITFVGDGTMRVVNATGYGDTNEHVESMPARNAIFVDGGNLNVSGVLNGQLTVGSSADVIITNNLIYNSNPRSNPGSTDVLGIVASRDVVLASGAPHDVNINAYIMALNGSFYYDSAYTAPARGDVTHIGGVTSRVGGCTGTFGIIGGGPMLFSGYNTILYYDTRFATQLNPPYFPILKNALGFSLFTKVRWREL